MEAPERAWMIVDEDGDLVGYQAAREDLVEYIRADLADLAGLPEELTSKTLHALELFSENRFLGSDLARVLRDILAWDRQHKEGKE